MKNNNHEYNDNNLCLNRARARAASMSLKKLLNKN